MSKIKEIMGVPAFVENQNWEHIIKRQHCPYLGKKCLKTRKSNPGVAIGTCTVDYGSSKNGVIICPHRLLERKQIFLDCIHLLQTHVPGNELHIVPEVSIPGGSVDYFLVSTDSKRKVKDFVGIELQTMDTTGSVWSERQKLLSEIGLPVGRAVKEKPYGMNWKMTAKTILVQLHHKISTFEGLNKHLVLVVQDCLVDYIKKEFAFSHVSTDARLGDSLHIHSYDLNAEEHGYKLSLSHRYSTDDEGIAMLLGLNTSANVEFEEIAKQLESKISDSTLLSFL